MSAPGSSKLMALVAVGAVTALVMASCVVPLRGDDDKAASGTGRVPSADPMALDLIRCRMVKSEQGADYDRCQRFWREYRRRFLGENRTSAARQKANPKDLQPEDAAPKDQSRLPQAAPGFSQPGGAP
jgi:conjugative transfer region protein TrbK